ncbi:MAG TPA: SAM-dependent chlorinase/fluorinase [Pyrinomonadaceae bacterium]|nr:SAM-dependent chlorinase/fluorinase [Pyrinomonadaceae bacterium]
MPIALLTDFGTRDHYVAAMKGAILSINPQAVIVDITHEIRPQNIRSAAFTLLACYKEFPAGTIFVVVVDPGVGSDRRCIAASSDGYYFVGPDNGVLSPALDENAKVVELDNHEYFAKRVSPTFHGRDVFAPIAAHLSNGIKLEELGSEINDPIFFEFPTAYINSDGTITAEIIHVDRFGNLISNLKEPDLPKKFEVEVGARQINKHCKFFAESEPGELVSIVGSSGFLEIVVNQGSAQKLLNARIGQAIRLIDKTREPDRT